MEGLPDEMIISICEQMDIEQLKSFLLTNRSYYRLCLPLYQRKIDASKIKIIGDEGETAPLLFLDAYGNVYTMEPTGKIELTHTNVKDLAFVLGYLVILHQDGTITIDGVVVDTNTITETITGMSPPNPEADADDIITIFTNTSKIYQLHVLQAYINEVYLDLLEPTIQNFDIGDESYLLGVSGNLYWIDIDSKVILTNIKRSYADSLNKITLSRDGKVYGWKEAPHPKVEKMVEWPYFIMKLNESVAKVAQIYGEPVFILESGKVYSMLDRIRTFFPFPICDLFHKIETRELIVVAIDGQVYKTNYDKINYVPLGLRLFE